MGLAQLNRIDIVSEAPGGARRCLIMVAGEGFPPAAEALHTVLAMLKCAGYFDHAARSVGGACSVELVSVGGVPRPLHAWLSARGVVVREQGQGSAPAAITTSRYAALPDGGPDCDALQAANAESFARRHDLPLPPSVDALDRFDDVLAQLRAEHGFDAGDGRDDPDRCGDLLVLAGAYAGEAIRRRHGGRWQWREAVGFRPLSLIVGKEGEKVVVVNPLGKVAKFLLHGREDSLASLAGAIPSILAAP
jgi:hypothetical protein